MIQLNTKDLQHISYTGFYGSAPKKIKKSHIRSLADKLLNDVDNVERWEKLSTPIIQSFLRRLIYEGDFSFEDKINE